MYEVFEQLLQKHNMSSYKLAKEAGVTQTALSNWKSGRSTPSTPTLQKIADYFGVTIDYLMTGRDDNKEDNELTTRDRRDITRDLNRIMYELEHSEDGPLFYEKQPLDSNHLFLLRNAIETALKDAKAKNKETYNPNKNKKQ